MELFINDACGDRAVTGAATDGECLVGHDGEVSGVEDELLGAVDTLVDMRVADGYLAEDLDDQEGVVGRARAAVVTEVGVVAGQLCGENNTVFRCFGVGEEDLGDGGAVDDVAGYSAVERQAFLMCGERHGGPL